MDIEQSEVYERLIGASIRFVSFRPRSGREIHDFLVRKLKKSHTYADSSMIEKVMARMRELKYLDDRKFALWWVEQRQTFKPKGTRLITLELLAKGVSRDIISEVVSIDSFEAARVALVKKLLSWKSYSADQQKKKAYDFLYRRGFDSQTISRVVDEVVAKVVK